MKRKLMWSLVASVGLAGTMAVVQEVCATPSQLFTGTTIAVGSFGDIDVANQVVREYGDGTPQKDLWLALQKTKGPSDLYVQNNVWQPGGTTGWHTHPGHSLIIVTLGAVTVYDADDPGCTGTTYTKGMGFVDEGGDHAHVIRNETSSEARTVAVQLLPAGAQRRIDLPSAPPSCGF